MRILVAFALAAMLSFPAVAQITPGSTGGTIGKTGKSVSGGEDQGEPSARTDRDTRDRQPASAKSSACSRVAGTWVWYLGPENVLNANGTFLHAQGDAGRWTCSGSIVKFFWNKGVVDTGILSPDGTRLSVSSGIGVSFVATRR